MSLNASRQEKFIGTNPLLDLYSVKSYRQKNAFDLIWPRKTRRRGHGVKPIYGSSRVAWHETILRYSVWSPSYFRNKVHLNIFSLPYNGLVRKLTWPQVTEIKIPRLTFSRYWWSNQLLKDSCWSLKNCGNSAITNILGGWVTWPDLGTWSVMTLGCNFDERCGKDAWKGLEKRGSARRRYSQETWGGGERERSV